jgi:lysophospholipase L1-like esterase
MRRLLRAVLERLLLLVVSLVVCIGIVEVYLRSVMEFQPASGAYVEDWDLGKRLAPGFVGEHYGAPVEINSHGMRDREYSLARSPEARRILVLGDSWTFGVGVAQGETWPRRLEAALASGAGPRYEVMNTGVSGYETYNEALYYERDLARFAHDLVLVGLYPVNDINAKHEKYARHKGLYELSPLLYYLYTVPKQHLMVRHWYKGWRRDRKLRRRAEHYAQTTKGAALPPVAAAMPAGFAPGEEDWTALYDDRYAGWTMMKQSLASIGRTARAAGVPGAVVLFPDLRDLRRYSRYCHPKIAPLLARATKEAGLQLIDLHDDFALRAGREAEIGLGGNAGATHPNAAGYDLIGRAVARELRARGLVR